MKTIGKVLLAIIGLIVLTVLLITALTPVMDRWGATDEEVAAQLPGDELVSQPVELSTRVVTVHAAPEEVYPWIAQIGADRGGYYSFTMIDHMINCKLVDINEIVPEFQDPQEGDIIKMCPNEPAPPQYVIARVMKNEGLILGHQDGEEWVESWLIMVRPTTDGNSRLIFRNRSSMTEFIWKVIHPGAFIMQYGMLNGIKARAEGTFSR